MKYSLNIIDALPDSFFEKESQELISIFSGPTLIHLKGEQDPPLFVSTLLHGNEVTGFEALKVLLKKYHEKGQSLPRSISIFLGNMTAASQNVRSFENQMDFNRIWEAGNQPEHLLAQSVISEMKKKGVFATVDIHNNTGVNPIYACINSLEPKFINLALDFKQTILYFTKPSTVLSVAFSKLAPSIVLECGLSGHQEGIQAASQYLEHCIALPEISNQKPEGSFTIYESIARIQVPNECTVNFSDTYDGQSDICFVSNLDSLNFEELAPGTRLGSINPDEEIKLLVWDVKGNECGEQYFTYENHEIRTRTSLIPSMLTQDQHAIHHDCLGYLIEPKKIN